MQNCNWQKFNYLGTYTYIQLFLDKYLYYMWVENHETNITFTLKY